MKKLVILFGLMFAGSQVLALDVVYPKKNDVTVNANSTFFIGSSQLPVKINNQPVTLHPTGAFAYVVNLKNGDNTFVLESGEERQIFVINKPVIKASSAIHTPVFQAYADKKSYYVTTENAPLRSTPVDAGINRKAHLPRNVEILADGEQGGFHRVILGNSEKGWISKTNVKAYNGGYTSSPATLSGYEYIDSDEYFTFIFHLDKKTPFEMVEGEPFLMKFYNVKDRPDNTYVMDFPVQEAMEGRRLLGYSGEYQGNDFVLKIRKPIIIDKRKPLHNLKIAVDAGHGGYESGAIGCLGDKEKDITLSVAKYLEAELKKRGAKVIMTRSDDKYVGLKERVDIANRDDALILLSIHGNALPDGQDPNKNSGTSIYYYYNQAKPLADTILNTLVSEIGVNNDKVRQASLALVRNTNALSLLIEVSYLINPEDNANLINPEFQKQYAKAIADSLETYFLNE